MNTDHSPDPGEVPTAIHGSLAERLQILREAETRPAGQDGETRDDRTIRLMDGLIDKLRGEKSALAAQLAQARQEAGDYFDTITKICEKLGYTEEVAARMEQKTGSSKVSECLNAHVETEINRLQAEKHKIHEEWVSLREQLAQAQGEVERLREEVDWQNAKNRNPAAHGAFEFYINEEWTGIARVALDDTNNALSIATLSKRRYDPDDERVRVRRVNADDALIAELATVRAEAERLRGAVETRAKEQEDAAREYTEVVNGIRDELTAARAECEKGKRNVAELGKLLATVRAECERLSGQVVAQVEANDRILVANHHLRAENAELRDFAREVREFVARYSPSQLSFGVLATKADAALAKHQP